MLHQIAAEGVRHIFGVGGANIEDLYDAIDCNRNIIGIVAKHEFSAVTMADGYARVGAGFGVVAATSGGGCLNLISGLGEAYASRIPVLALVGQPSSETAGTGAFQDGSGRNGSLDIEAIFRPVSVFCRCITEAADAMDALHAAIAAARQGGPAVLLLPKNVQQARFVSSKSSVVQISSVCTEAAASRMKLDNCARLLAGAASRIVIIAGDEVARRDARAQLAQLATALNACIAVTPDAKDVVDPAAPSLLGVAGIMGHPSVAAALSDAALCLLVGTRLPMVARGGLKRLLRDMPILSIGSEPPFVPSTHWATSDLRTWLTELIDALPPQPKTAHPAIAPLPRCTLPVPDHQGRGLRYADAVGVIDRMTPAGADIFVDAGNTGAASIHHLPVRKDGRFVAALGMGGMGYSFGAAIGSAFARGRRTIVVAGDGAFYMHGMEIHTAIEHHLPITFIVFDNSAHAMCVTREKIYYDAQYSFNRFHPAQLGNGMGAMFPRLPAFTATNVEELSHALAESVVGDGPSFVAVCCDSAELPPFAPFLEPFISSGRH
ncbi:MULTISPECIES: thiamine pyrophosphate-binding protein [Burkholderia]|uniref:thiamine pyrophosphate-binding protein n=1 Tax=Burkholderia TaxID=32008 RepID=UPI0018D2F6B4|nr:MULTISPECIES: thiamine pyrophosphate-binding protein [unclassified Burkholderia]